MVFVLGWLFTLNCAVLLTVSCLVNNPWTMVPIYATDYLVGDWLLGFFGINGMNWNPAWVSYFNTFLTTHVGINGVSLWSFLIGGNLLGLCISGMLYPILKRFLHTNNYT